MEVEVFVEIPKFSKNKYEFEEGKLKLDRALYGPVYFPFDYGFIENTKGEDGDPIDALLLVSFPTFPGCRVKGKVIGILEMEDESGIDHKVLVVPTEKIDPRMGKYQNVDELPEHLKTEIKEFFEIYKRLEPGKWVKVKEFKGVKEAEEFVKKCRI